MMFPGIEVSQAVISEDGRYRYRLDRRWAAGPACCFIMLNPSTADATRDDATIRRCIGFAKREGCGALVVGNLFAFRSTDPGWLGLQADPCGPENRRTLTAIAAEIGGPAIAAWGAHWMTSFDNSAAVVREIFGDRLVCLGATKSGAPRHPLYVRSDAPLVQWGGA